MKILALFTIFVLIFGTTSFVNDAYAQNDLSILLRIATQADKQIQNQLHQVYGNDVPEKIQSLYDKGHMTVNSLEKSLPDDVKQAKKDFLTSMKLFKQISKMISEPVAKVQIIASHVDQSSQLDRLEKYVLTLKTVSQKLDAKINFENVDDLLLKARNQVNDGTENPSETIIELKSSIKSIQKDIREFASHSASERIKQFVDKEDKITTSNMSNRDQSSQLDRLEKYVLTLKTISQKLDAKINFENVDDLLLKARNQVNDGTENPSETIIELKSSIKSIQKDIREFASHSAYDRIKQFVDKEDKITTSNISNRDQSSQLDRLEKYVLTLKTISQKLDAKINFENVDDLLLKARNQVNDGTENPSETIIELKSSIKSIQKDIRELASHIAYDRIKQFVDRQLDRIEKKLDKAEEIGADQNQINKAHELIDEIKALIDKNQINDAKIVFHELHKLLKNIQYSVG